jgi:hypothetical protein
MRRVHLSTQFRKHLRQKNKRFLSATEKREISLHNTAID